MKLSRKLFAVLLSAILVLTMAVPAFADGVNEENTTTTTATTGSITIENATKGQTYEIYKIFDATYSTVTENSETKTVVSYTIPEDSEIAETSVTIGEGDGAKSVKFSDIFTTSTTGGAIYVTKADGVQDSAVIEWLTAYVATLDEADDFEIADGTNVVFDNLYYGYYFVTSTLGSAVTVNSATPDVTIVDKNVNWEKPYSDGFKNIVIKDSEGNETDLEDSDDYNEGQDIKFVIGFTAQNYALKDGENEMIKEYTVVDTPTGIAIKDDIVVKLDYGTENKTLTRTTEEEEGDYTLEVNKDTGAVTIKITWAKQDEDGNWYSLYDAPVEVVINYTGTLTATTATNKAAISAISIDGDEFKEETPDPDLENDIYTYTIQVKKVDGNDNTVTLKGAEFILTKVIDDEEDGDASTTYYYSVDDNGTVTWVTDQKDATVVTTDDDGLASFAGLGYSDDYELIEVKAPAGYNLLTKPEPVTLKAVDLEAEGGYTYNAADWLNTKTIVNNAGSALPQTGGMGTTILYILGTILVLGAGVILVVRRRMSAEQ